MAEKLIATIGGFDGVHRGHQALIHELTQISVRKNIKPMVITFDRKPSAVINPQRSPFLLTPEEEKKSLIKSFGVECICVLPFTYELAQMTAKEFLYYIKSKFNIHYLLMGFDHKFGSDRIEDINKYIDLGKHLGIEIIRSNTKIILEERVSSSKIRHFISNDNVKKANELLGYNYRIKGSVIEGMKIGRTMGYPTANIQPYESNKMLPSHGVYAVFVHFENGRYPAMLYIGRRPTMNDGRSITIEVNIFDMTVNLYAKEIEIEFIEYTRGDCKFNSLEELRLRIEADEKEIRQILSRY